MAHNEFILQRSMDHLRNGQGWSLSLSCPPLTSRSESHHDCNNFDDRHADHDDGDGGCEDDDKDGDGDEDDHEDGDVIHLYAGLLQVPHSLNNLKANFKVFLIHFFLDSFFFERQNSITNLT